MQGFSGIAVGKTGTQTIIVQVSSVAPDGNVFISAVPGGTYCENVAGGASVSFTTDITGGVSINCSDGACP